METPPPFEPSYSPQKPKRSPTVVLLIVLGVLGLCCVLPVGALSIFGVGFLNQNKGSISCLMTMGLIQSAMKEYEKEKGAFPPAENWQAAIKPYYDRLAGEMNSPNNPFRPAPLDGVLECRVEGDVKTIIAFNTEIAGKKLADLKDADAQVIVWEMRGSEANAAAPFQRQPDNEAPKMMGQRAGWLKMTIGESSALTGTEEPTPPTPPDTAKGE